MVEQIGSLRSTIEKELLQIQEDSSSGYPSHNNCKISVEFQFIKKIGFDQNDQQMSSPSQRRNSSDLILSPAGSNLGPGLQYEIQINGSPE